MIKVLFFAQLRDQLGISELNIESNDITVDELLEILKEKDDNWRKCLSTSTLMIAVNQTISHKKKSLKSGDEVAFFPPVTGG